MPTGPRFRDDYRRNQLSTVDGIATESRTATASAGAATLNANFGVITSEALTTAQDAAYTLTLTNDKITAASIVVASIQNGTNTQGTTVMRSITPAAGSVVFVIMNKHATAQALNGTIKVSFMSVTVI